MTGIITEIFQIGGVASAAIVASAVLRRSIRALTRRAVRRGQQRPGTWRGRLRRLGELDSEMEARRRQRADAAARMVGHFVTTAIVLAATLWALHVVGVDPVYAISSAGFLGVALALSGQHLVKDILAGSVALFEDRYSAGDQVLISVSGAEVRGTIDIMGPVSVRLRTEDGATWHAGHSTIECVTNYSQLAASAEIAVDTVTWADVEDDAAHRLATASNDVGLTGVVFLPDLAAQEHPTGVTTVTVRSNRPLSDSQRAIVRDRLTDAD